MRVYVSFAFVVRAFRISYRSALRCSILPTVVHCTVSFLFHAIQQQNISFTDSWQQTNRKRPTTTRAVVTVLALPLPFSTHSLALRAGTKHTTKPTTEGELRSKCMRASGPAIGSDACGMIKRVMKSHEKHWKERASKRTVSVE